MIAYFTGTGNSRYVAEMLGDLLEDEVFSINESLRQGKQAVWEGKKPLVFVCPVYVSAPPRIFLDFIRKASISGCRKVYFIVTSAGTSVCACPYYTKKLASEKSLLYMGTANVTMPQNYLVMFKTKEKAESDAIVASAESRIKELAAIISRQEEFPDPGVKKWEIISTEMCLDFCYNRVMKAKKFTVGDSCISCGTCERVCPLGNVKLADGKPVWGDACTHCMACINLCPKSAIEYGKGTVGKPRYKCIRYQKQN